MDYQTAKEKLEAAQTLLDTDATSKDKLDSIASLLTGINPTLDRVLGDTTAAFEALGKLESGDVIDLALEHAPVTSQKDKKRKKAFLLFLKYWKELKSEVARVQAEFDSQRQSTSSSETLKGFGRVVGAAKGPLGLITIAAIAAVIIVPRILRPSLTTPTSPPAPSAIKETPTKSTIRAISFNGKIIPLDQLEARTGDDCDSEHYHAKNGRNVTTTDGTILSDPGGCGFGRVNEVEVIEVNP
ncbi:MAG: hypothetical protein UY16_C0021G0011 [Candidatus Gottesmanbacteria bacterium GW2011_GWA2_47_9]|uniref:Uncharacterized protein n=1 Tax=Candidatus Gottesmanbacteria bacterium GW2011_GWA2_47_9 TaxID=1618445 RepID=A0A0G1U0T1_9BACT|nr:MAG: hypothetical protein UY16_C0021G0011 [Candidatus Gottesmanbacteria bacterium GW2011_GWA2_47_9]